MSLCAVLVYSYSDVMQTFVLLDGWNPLYASNFEGHLDVVKTLIKAGANINLANEFITCMQCPINLCLHVYDIIACEHSVHATKAIQTCLSCNRASSCL